MAQRRSIFDAHFHIGPFGTQTYAGRAITPIPTALDGSEAACLRHLRRHGLRGGVIVPTYLDDQRAACRYSKLVRQVVERRERLLGGLWESPLPEMEGLCKRELQSLPHPRIRALKIASNTWRSYSIDPGTWSARVRRNVERILEAARNHRLVVHLHTGYLEGADPLSFEAFMGAYGHAATYQFVHMGEAIAPVFAFTPSVCGMDRTRLQRLYGYVAGARIWPPVAAFGA